MIWNAKCISNDWTLKAKRDPFRASFTPRGVVGACPHGKKAKQNKNATLSVIVWAIERRNLLDEANIQMQTYIRINTTGGAFTWRICYRNKIYR